MKVLLDTCALIWWTLDAARLTPLASEAVSQAETIHLSTISVWELGIKVKRNKLRLPLPIRDFTELLKRSGKVRFVPVDESIWVQNLELCWDHQDPADRTIVATAILCDLPIVTADKVIAAFYPRVVW